MAHNNKPCRGIAILEVSVPLHDVSVWDVCAVAWSFVPWIFSVYLIVRCAWSWKYSARVCTLFLVMIIMTNEYGTKRVLGSPRPASSCLTSLGMPSSHAVVSIGMLLYILLELFLGCNHINGFKMRTPKERVALATFLACLLGPVPASRVHLEDHSAVQVIAGSAIGATMALAFFVSHASFRRRRHRLKARRRTDDAPLTVDAKATQRDLR